MDERAIRKLLKGVKTGAVSVDAAAGQLKDLPFADLGYATVDTHRGLRTGFPEVVYGERKSQEQVLGIVATLVARRQPVLVTRVAPSVAESLVARYPAGEHFPVARIFRLGRSRLRSGTVAVVSAGTSDASVAEEAAVTAEALGATVRRVYDVGVAGIHRLLRRRQDIQSADAAVVVAGMEGALASAVGGLVGIPVVAVPTSVGYGANFFGLSALLAMLNSCASNVATVNIDNGFGGGFYAALVARRKGRR